MAVEESSGGAARPRGCEPAPGAATAAVRRVRWIGARWAPLLAAAIALPLTVVTTVGTLRWPGRPFPGFFVMENAVVPTIGLPGWTGLVADVPFHARVLAVDGAPVHSSGEVYAHVEALPIGTRVHYTLIKGATVVERTVPTMRFGAEDYWLTVGLFVINGVLMLIAGVLVASLQPRHPEAQAFLVLCVATGLFGLTGTSLYLPDCPWLTRLHYLTQATFPATFIHFGLVFPIVRPRVVRRPRWLLLPYLVAAGITAGIWQDLAAPRPTLVPLYAAYLFSALSIVLLIGLPALAYWENRTPMVRPRVYAVVPGIVLATGIALYNFLDTARSGGHFPTNYVALTPFLFFLAVAYAIAKHDLFDIDALLKRTLVYVTLTLGISLAYAGALVVVGIFVPQRVAQTSPLFTIAFFATVAFLFDPLRGGVQHVLDRTFFRTRLDYRRTVGELSAALTSLLDLDDVLLRLGRTVSEGFALEGFGIVVWAAGETRVWIYGEGSRSMEERADLGGPALRAVLARVPQRPLTAADFGAFDGADGAAVRRMLAENGVTLVVPLAVGATVTGAFVLGAKRSGLAFSGEDLDLLRTLAAQSAIAVQNALSYQELAALNQELEVKVRARTAELEASNTDLAHAYDELKAAQAQLLQTEKLASLGQLVAGVAHEINNPVSFIVGNTEALRAGLAKVRAIAAQHDDVELARVAERVSRIFDIMARGAERTAGIVNDLRTFSRVGEGAPRQVDVHEAIEVTLRLLKPRWADGIDIHRDYGRLPAIEVVPGQLNQVLMNVLANACDAVGARGNVWITTAPDERGVRIAIRDDGAGILPEHLGRIFDPFFTTKPQGKGTGLGLALSQGIVLQHGGAITVESTPGHGTTVTVVLPCQLPAAAMAGAGTRRSA
ncbi:MAG: ATP-binding protein [Candidatus Binatia bacterium]